MLYVAGTSSVSLMKKLELYITHLYFFFKTMLQINRWEAWLTCSVYHGALFSAAFYVIDFLLYFEFV